jgi:hypothetical protein
MRIEPTQIYRQFALWFTWREVAYFCGNVVAILRLRADHCRDCDHEVRFTDTVCGYCGTRDPVRLPGWVSTIIVGFAVSNMIALAGRVIGA